MNVGRFVDVYGTRRKQKSVAGTKDLSDLSHHCPLSREPVRMTEVLVEQRNYSSEATTPALAGSSQ